MEEFKEIVTLIGIIATAWMVGFFSYMAIELIKVKK
jgi:hypothetical protein